MFRQHTRGTVHQHFDFYLYSSNYDVIAFIFTDLLDGEILDSHSD